MSIIKVKDWMFDEIYSRGYRHKNTSHCRINWKDTDVCADIRCFKCNTLNQHYDGPYFFFWKCQTCGTHYAVDKNITLIELTEEQVTKIGEQKFHTTNPHVDFWIDQDAIKMVQKGEDDKDG